MKITYCFLTYILVILFSDANAQRPVIKWWYNTNDASFGQTAAGDIDNDGKLEFVFGCYRNDSSVYALNAENGSLLWKVNTHPTGFEGCNDVAPTIYDVDNNGTKEVIVPSSCNPKTFCFNGINGSIKWQTPSSGSDSPPTIADIDNDGKPEILHGGFDGHVMCINAENGSVAWSLSVDENSWVQTAPTIVDLDNNGQLDFVVATEKSDTNRVYAYRGDTHTLLWKYTMNDWVYHGTAVADLDNDGKPELVIGDYSGKLVVLNGENGSEAWTYTYSTNSGFYIGSPASIADLDGDGFCEIIFCNWFKIIALRNNGTLFWNYTIPNYETAFRGVVLSDINNDNLPDAVFGTSNGMVIALKGTTGDTLWTIDLALHYGNSNFSLDHAPVISDFDGDGKLDLFIVGGHAEYPNFQNDFGRAYALSIGYGSGPDWLMFQHDIRRQSSLCEFASNINNIEPDQKINIYPNPANDRIIITDLNKGEIEILNVQGEIINNFKISASNTSVDISNLAAGIYFLRIKTKEGIHTKKFIKTL